MNKLTKNFEQIIASVTALGIIILTMFCMASCVSTQNVHINDIYKYKKSNLYDKCYTFAKK